MSEELQIRTYGSAEQPALIYLPGLHGDWTLIGGFRRALGGRVRFVEVTYPRTLTWSLEDYAAGVEQGLAERGIGRGWLLAESFSSQIAWKLIGRNRFRAEGVVLAGGFVRHPLQLGVWLAEWLCGGLPLGLITRILFGYGKAARKLACLRHRHNPEVFAGLDEFIARRTELDRQAAKHRLHLIAQSNLARAAQQCQTPVYALSGLFDPVVPWFGVRRWLKKNCPALRQYRILRADHNVLSTASQAAADQIVEWMMGQ
jgi:pimeloyl-ACP methyl ester carboxylesterase